MQDVLSVKEPAGGAVQFTNLPDDGGILTGVLVDDRLARRVRTLTASAEAMLAAVAPLAVTETD